MTTQTPIKLRIQGDLIDLTQNTIRRTFSSAAEENVRRVVNTTVGRVIFNDSYLQGLPSSMAHSRRRVAVVVNYSHIRLVRDDGQDVTISRRWASSTRQSRISIGIDDLVTPDARRP